MKRITISVSSNLKKTMDIIRIDGLRKSVGSFRLGPLDLRVEPGAIVGVVGPKDAGKTTLMRLLWGFSRPDRGIVEVYGMKPHLKQMEVRLRAGYMAEFTWYYPELSIAQFLTFIGNFYPQWDQTRTNSLLERFDLTGEMKIESLSLTGRRTVGLIAALGHRPSLLILDQPTAGIDASVRNDMLDFLRQLAREDKVTIVLSSQVPDEFDRIADGVLTLSDGRQVAEFAQ